MDPFRFLQVLVHGNRQPENFILLIDEIKPGGGGLPAVTVGPEGQEIRVTVHNTAHVSVIVWTPVSQLLCHCPVLAFVSGFPQGQFTTGIVWLGTCLCRRDQYPPVPVKDQFTGIIIIIRGGYF